MFMTSDIVPREQSSASHTLHTVAAHSLHPCLPKALLGEVASCRKERGVKFPVFPGGASGERFILSLYELFFKTLMSNYQPCGWAPNLQAEERTLLSRRGDAHCADFDRRMFHISQMWNE